MMKRSLLVLPALAAAVLCGLAIGLAHAVHPDMHVAAAMLQMLMPHADIGSALMLAAGPVAMTGPQLRGLKAKLAGAKDSMRAVVAAAEKEDRDLTAEEAATFATHKADATQLTARIERAQELMAEEAGAVEFTTLEGTSDNRAADPRHGFSSMGDFARAVAAAGIGQSRDERLGFSAQAPSTYGNESSGVDGGFAIPPQFSSELWRLSIGEGSLLPETANTEITGNSMIFPKDESTPWGGTGVQAYWQVEAKQATESKPQIGSGVLVLHKMMALVPVTNELMADGFAIGSYLTPLITDRIMWKTNEAILFGDGVGKPQGALNSPAAVVQAKETGQATATLDPKNISKMVSRLLVGEMGNARWIATPDILSALETLTVGQYPIYLPGQTAEGAPYGMLKGRPLMLSEHAAAFSSQGDLNLLSLKGYRTITKAGGLETATSMHLYFDADTTAFRVTFRMNGAPIMSAPITPPKSGVTRSHFVSLGAR